MGGNRRTRKKPTAFGKEYRQPLPTNDEIFDDRIGTFDLSGGRQSLNGLSCFLLCYGYRIRVRIWIIWNFFSGFRPFQYTKEPRPSLNSQPRTQALFFATPVRDTFEVGSHSDEWDPNYVYIMYHTLCLIHYTLYIIHSTLFIHFTEKGYEVL